MYCDYGSDCGGLQCPGVTVISIMCIFQEIEKFQLDQTMRSTAKQATSAEHVEAPMEKVK